MRNDIVTYQYGTTVRFEVTFFDFADQVTQPDPNTVKLVIYDERYNVIFDSSDSSINPEGNLHSAPDSEGSVETSDLKYVVDFTTPRKDQRLFYEWSGKIQSKISLQRGEFNTRFLR